MKTALGLTLTLVPLFFMSQDKAKKPRPGPDAPFVRDSATPSPTPKSKGQFVPLSDLEVARPSTLYLDPACNACRGVPITIDVHNKSSKNIPLVLAVGDATSVQGEKAFNATVTLVPLNGEGHDDPGTVALAGGKNVKIKATVVGTLEQGTWEVSLLNQGKPFGKFKIQNPPVTFDVKPEIVDNTNPELKFRRGEKTLINIRNDDVLSYRVECVYTIGEFRVPCEPEKPDNEFPGTSKVSSQESVRVFVNPDPQWFTIHQTGRWDRLGSALHSLRGLLADYTADGQLTIRLRSANCASDPAAPVKSFKFKSRLAMHAEEAIQIAGFVIIFLVLLGGALLSVLANLLLPGAARRLKVKEELAIVARKVNDLSLDLDSRIRVPLGVERARLGMRLEELGTVSPDFSTAIGEIEKDVNGLRARVDLVEKLELVVRRYWKMRRENRLSISLTQEIDDLRQQAIDILARSEPKDTDLQNAQTLIHEIEKRITNIDQPNPAFAQQLVARLIELQKAMSRPVVNASDTLRKLNDDLRDLFEKLWEDLPRPEDIKPVEYVDLDTTAFRLEIIRRYAALVQSPMDGDQARRLQECRNTLLALLRQSGWDSLGQANSLIQQLEENVFPVDVADSIKKHEVQIEADRNLVYQFESVGFRLLFLNKKIGSSTARREFTIKWDFGDGLTERGGWISHYFVSPTRLGSITPLAQIVQRLAFWLTLGYFIVGLLTVWWESGLNWRTLLLNELIALILTIVVIALTPLGRRFWLALKKKLNPNLAAQETDPTYQRPPYKLNATLVSPDGSQPADGPLVIPYNLEVLKTARTRFPATFWVETTRIAIALLIALVTLVSGAKEQLLKLDVFPALVAIFMIGFGANEVKKLFSQNPQA